MSVNDTEYVIIGVKPLMNYVVACMTMFNEGTPELKIRARGRHIAKAVEVAEMLRRVFIKDVIVGRIELGTEHHINPAGKESSVSTIVIPLRKP